VEITSILLSSGIALLIVLVGWSSQITSKGKELKETEKSFIEKAKIKESKYKKMVQEKGSTEKSFQILIEFLFKHKDKDVEIFEKIKEIKTDFQKLNEKYNMRFWILVSLSISFFITGFLTFFVESDCKLLNLDPKIWIMFINTIPITIAYINLIQVYNTEKKFAQTIYDVMEKL
jgi:hypothetical protein